MGEAGALYCWKFAEIHFDESKRELHVGGVPVDMEQKPLQVLSLLLRQAGAVVSKAHLFETVWEGRVTVDHVLATAIGKLRKAFGGDGYKIIVTVPRLGYRIAVPVEHWVVGRALISRMELKPGNSVPWRDRFVLDRQLGSSDRNEVWLARHIKTGERRVYKFCLDGAALRSLKREVTVYRLLHESLGVRDDLVRIIDWNFETAPFFIECEYGGQNLSEWSLNSDVPPWRSGDAMHWMSLEERLAFFLGICCIVSDAHSVGVLHRDLKPANVLVYERDGKSLPKLTDFGSSRLLEPGRLQELGITRLGMTHTQADGDAGGGTPLYLAPELIAGQAPTVRSDVYALGVMLYQLLVGDFSKPMAPGWEWDVADEFLREDIAKATDGHPSRRLGSVSELSARLSALSDRRSEREREAAARKQAALTEKALERANVRRPWVIATITALAVGLCAAIWLLVQSSQARFLAESERDRSEAVVAFLTEDIIGGGGFDENLTIQELLKAAEASVERRFPDRPLDRAAIWRAMADAAWALHDYSAASVYYRNAEQDAASTQGPDADVALAAAYNYAWALTLVGTSAAISEAATVLERADELAGSDRLQARSDLALSAARAHASYYYQQIEPELALGHLRQAVELLRELHPEELLNRFDVQSQIVETLLRLGRLQEAEESARVLESEITQTGSPEGAALHAAVLALRARALRALGRFDEAIEILNGALRKVPVMSQNSLSTLGIKSQLAAAYSQSGDCVSALHLMRDISSLSSELKGSDSRWALVERGNLAFKEYDCGDVEAGLKLLQDVIQRLSELFGEDDAASQAFRAFLASAYETRGRYAEALDVLSKLDPQNVSAATSNPDWSFRLPALRGMVLAGLGRRAEARKLLEESVPELMKLQPDDPELKMTIERYVETLNELQSAYEE